jgi:hypothetical protein
MIIKGSARKSGAKALADHLGNAKDNEKVNVLSITGTMASTMLEAFQDFEAVASGSRSNRPYYHASISPNRTLTDEQRDRAIDLLEEKLGLEGQPRVVVEHVKEGRQHWHVVWQRFDLERERMIDYSHNYRRHEEVARQCEREFGHEPIVGAHVRDKEAERRPERAPSHHEQKQGERLGIDAREVRTELTDLWRQAENSGDFQRLVAEHGYTLARGDKRDLVIFDREGGVHSLARRIEGETVRSIRERLHDLDPANLPSVAEVQAERAMAEARSAEQASTASAPPFEAEFKPPEVMVAEAPVIERGAPAPVAARDAAEAEIPSPAITDAQVSLHGMEAAAERIGLEGATLASDMMETVVETILEVLMPSLPPTPEEARARAAANEERKVAQAVWEMNEAAYKAWVAQREEALRSEDLVRGVNIHQSEEQRRMEREAKAKKDRERGWERE